MTDVLMPGSTYSMQYLLDLLSEFVILSGQNGASRQGR